MEKTKGYIPTLGELKTIEIMKSEHAQWHEGAVFVTDEYQYIMRNVIKKARRNYLGIFSKPNDPITGRKKIFVPFTKTVVKNVNKNIDIDTKDLDVKARHGKETDYLKARFFRQILQKKLKDINFGKTLNKMLLRLSIDGTAFLKAGKDEDGKLYVTNVDRLNMLYDQSVEEIEASSGKTERHVLTKPEFDQLGYLNSEYVQGVSGIEKVDFQAAGVRETSPIPYVEVYERYGWFPKVCLTNKQEDANTYIYGHAIVSGLQTGEPVRHLMEEVEADPYGVMKLSEVPNRADGEGIPEMLFDIQAYLNEVVNTRLNKGRIVGLGLAKMKGNVTPQQFKRLFTTGGIKLDAQSDFEFMNTGSIDPSSYRDEEQAYTWGTRVTGSTQEDEINANRPATNAMIQQQGASKGYNLTIENVFLALAQFIEKKMLPIIKEELKANKDELIRITGDEKIFAELDEVLVENAVQKEVQKVYETTGYAMSEEEIQAYKDETAKNIKKLGKDRFIPIVDELLDTEFDLYFTIDGENINKALIAQSLQQVFGMLLQTGQLPQAKEVMRELFDAMGLDSEKLTEEDMQPTQQMQMAMPEGMTQGLGEGQPTMPTPQVN